VKIHFQNTSARIAQLHALGFVPHPDYQLVPLVGLRKKPAPAEKKQANEKIEPEWHQLVPLEELDQDGHNSPKGILDLLKKQQAAQQRPLAQAA
jgi:hypothetical protein